MATTKRKPKESSLKTSPSFPEGHFVIEKGPKVKVIGAFIDWPPNKPANEQERVFDIRTWVLIANGDWIPTAKGVQIPADMSKKFCIRARKAVTAEFEE